MSAEQTTLKLIEDVWFKSLIALDAIMDYEEAHKIKNEPADQKTARMAATFLLKFGFKKESILFKGDSDLVYGDVFTFTQKSLQTDLFEIIDTPAGKRIRIDKPDEASRLFAQVFTPAKVEALKYELSEPKGSEIDETRMRLLAAAGLSTKPYRVECLDWEEKTRTAPRFAMDLFRTP